ncbi:MAG: V-type ATP synthase subunit I [Methanobacteriaceae archaeon]|jgi:V/A-type H+-transporting ATPase subunit I|nr:V-type ATP synthase subunit I [Candidatus Methanorudis spinitermitis]
MFQTARMRKLKVITLDQYTDDVVGALHEKGIVQIDDISERIQQNPEWAQLLKPSKATPKTGKIASLLMKTTGISETFGNVLTEEVGIKDMLMSFIRPDIPVKKEVESLNTDDLINRAESILKEVESQTKVLEDKLSALDDEKSGLESNKSLAEKLINLDMDLALLSDTKYTSTIVGRMNVESALKFKDEVNSITDKLLIIEEKDEDKVNEIIIIVTLNEYKEDIYSLFRKFEFEKFDVESLEGKPDKFISYSKTKLEEIDKETSQVFAQLKKVANKWDDDILILKEQLEIEKERNEIFATFGQTEKTIMLEAWVPIKEVEEAKKIIENVSEGNSVIEDSDVEFDDENVPIKHDTNWYSKSYEFITDLYGPLKYGEMDPTVFLSITLPFFFGFCLTDSFYAIIYMIIGFIVVKGIGKANKTMKDFGKVFMMCAFWTIILGLLTGGFIGDFLPRFLNIPLPTVIPAIDAFVHPENILIMAIASGIVYLNIGFIIGIINNWKFGDKKEALTSQIVWFILEAGVVFLAMGMLVPTIGMIGTYIGVALLIVSLGLLIYGGGAYGVMDIFSFIGDLASFARLLALCLATGGFAMTVNILTEMVLPTQIDGVLPVILLIASIIVFLGGHLFNFLFQALGAFIAGLRLNFVEFFAQFFKGGKNIFKAFGSERIYTKLKD